MNAAATDDESYARQLQAQFLAEEGISDDNIVGLEVEDNHHNDNVNDTDHNINSHHQELTDVYSNTMQRTLGGGDDWTDDHMTDEELAMMLESMQTTTTTTQQLNHDINESLPSDGKISAVQEEDEEAAMIARQFEEDERLARTFHSHSPNKNNDRTCVVEPSDSVRAIDNIGQSLPSSTINKKEKKGTFRMKFFGTGSSNNKQQPSGNKSFGTKLMNPIMNIPSILAATVSGSRDNNNVRSNSIGSDHQSLPSNSENRVSSVPDSTKSSISSSLSSTNNFLPKCDGCGRVAMTFISALGKKFHASCFRCAGCHEVIDPSEPFAFIGEYEKQPLHRGCYAELYGIKCSVCTTPLSPDEQGRISYIKHPFFDKECMCPSHAVSSGARRCTGCHRFEPIMNKFADLGDNNRCVCWSCCRTVIVDSKDALPLWKRVLYFMEHHLGLPIWTGMSDIPLLVVDHDTLNERSQRSAHHGSKQIMTRGLCLSEHHIGRRFRIPKLRYDSIGGRFAAADAEGRGLTFFRIPDASKSNPNTNVTAILCLSGMPRDLAASILAHEATHAWIKMHPDYDATKPLPPIVEEGCCQLIAHLVLTDGLDPASNDVSADGGTSDEKLRQYFKFSIETDEDAVYGEGFRRAYQLPISRFWHA